ncbi:MAG: phosphonate ABC transporter, permease protein PhnE [Desulfobacterales bacterium]|nr:phosphonate ABC transporter, permease protein PhnE [Desulfobacterales bacterium]
MVPIAREPDIIDRMTCERWPRALFGGGLTAGGLLLWWLPAPMSAYAVDPNAAPGNLITLLVTHPGAISLLLVLTGMVFLFSGLLDRPGEWPLDRTARIGREALALPRAPRWKRWILMLAWAVALFLLVWAWRGSQMNPGAFFVRENQQNMALFAQGFAPPDFANWREYRNEMIVTIQIAIWGTLLAVLGAVPFGLMSARNIAPAWIRQPTRRLMDVFRAVNEMVFALLFVTAVGLGPFAGVLALFVHTMGTLAKLFSEAVEAIDPRPVEGIRATGAHSLEEIAFGVIPQVMPLWLSYSLYRFESNVRSATVLGIVGAGGIGLLLWDAMRNFEYMATAAILVIIVVVVSVIDLISSAVRKAFI